MKYFTICIDGHSYTIAPGTNSTLIIQDNEKKPGEPCKKIIRVEGDTEYRYKVMKTKVKAKDGAEGLYKWLASCYEQDFCVALANKVLKECIDYVKGV